MKKLLLVFVLLLSLFTGCTSKQTKICTTAYPISYLVEQIGGERVSICSISEDVLIQRANIVPEFESLLNSAMLLIHISGLEPYYDLYLKEIRDTKVSQLDLSLHASVYEFGRYTYVRNNSQEALVESDYYDSKAFAMIDTYDKDPILWMDPIAMASMARAIKDWLVTQFPESEVYFSRNYERVEADLVRLDAEFQSLRNERKTVKLVTMTPNFGNWQKTFGVQVYPVILSKYGALPNDAQLQLIKDRIIADDVKYIANESNLPPDMQTLYDALVEELDLKPIILNNLGSISEENLKNNEDYLKLMYDNLTALESISE